MKFAVNYIESIRAFLSSEFWSGKRWLAFDVFKKETGVADLQCFPDYKKAALFCEANSSNGKAYRIKEVGYVLRTLNQGSNQKATVSERQALQELASSYPITLLRPDEGLAACLWTGEYFPVIWNKVINPLTTIQSYHIIEQWFVDNWEGNVKLQRKAASTYERFSSAIEALEKQLNSCYTGRNDLQFILLGQFRNHQLSLDEQGIPIKNTGMLLYRAYYLNAQCYLYQVNDPTSPFLIQNGIFIRYNRGRRQLNFYDSSLKKVLPGTYVDYIDLNYFFFQ